MEQFMTIMFELLEGFGNTLLLFIITLVLALPLGLLFAFGSMSKFKPLQWLMKTVITFTLQKVGWMIIIPAG